MAQLAEILLQRMKTTFSLLKRSCSDIDGYCRRTVALGVLCTLATELPDKSDEVFLRVKKSTRIRIMMPPTCSDCCSNGDISGGKKERERRDLQERGCVAGNVNVGRENVSHVCALAEKVPYGRNQISETVMERCEAQDSVVFDRAIRQLVDLMLPERKEELYDLLGTSAPVEIQTAFVTV